MTKRRKFLLGMGSLAAGGAAAIGSGAFSSVWADRDVTATVTGDGSAYLGLVDKSEYASYSDNELGLDFPDLNENANSRFHNVFWIRNNGTQDVSVKAYTLDQSGNLDGWATSDFALYWTEDEVSGGDFGLPYEAMHDVPSWLNDPAAGPNSVIPRLSPGEAIAVHPQFFLRGDEDTGDTPSTIAFYATKTQL